MMLELSAKKVRFQWKSIQQQRRSDNLTDFQYSACDNGAIRFVNGQTLWEGRVEVCKDQVWGTVCDDFWSNEDAGVACRQAGYSGFSK